MISKKIHYCWFGRNPLPSDVKRCIKSWKKYAPDYEIIEWNEKNFDINCHPFVKSAYKNKAWAFVSDYARLKIIYDNGGIYFDTDVELLKSPDFLLESQCFIGMQQNGSLCTTGLGYGAVKGSSVVGAMLKKYDNIIYNEKIKNKIACPWLNNEVIQRLGYKTSDEIVYLDEVTVYPARYFDPYPSGTGSNLLCDDTVSIHHYSASWTSGKQRFKRKLARIIGEDKILFVKKMIKKN